MWPAAAPPGTIILTGTLRHQRECLGEYVRAHGREAFGSPVWTHLTHDRCIAKTALHVWMVQTSSGVGAKGAMSFQRPFLQLLDGACTYPHESHAAWQEDDGNAWRMATDVQLTLPGMRRTLPDVYGSSGSAAPRPRPPPWSYTLDGSLTHHGDLGLLARQALEDASLRSPLP